MATEPHRENHEMRSGSRNPQAIVHEPHGLVPQLVHELKTALANVVHGAELLTEELLGTLSPQQREVALILRDNACKLQLLIEYLAAFDRWREQAGRPTASRFALKPVLERCVQRFQPIAAPHNIRIELTCGEIEVCADSLGLGLILDNLVSHALQVSPASGAVAVGAAVGPGAQLVIDIADEGPRIEPAQRENILSTFSQDVLIWKGDRPAARGGLAVARDCASAHGGSVELFDRPARGAHFRVRLPMAGTGVMT